MREFGRLAFDLIQGEFAGINLVGFKDFDKFYENQIEDSLLPLEVSENFKENLQRTRTLLDIGFGGGYPLLPIAKVHPEYKVYGIDTKNKKATAVQEFAQRLGLPNVKTFHGNINEIIIDIPVTITFKAVGRVDKFLKMIHNTEVVAVYFYKGPSFWDDEGKGTRNLLSNKISLIEDLSYELSGGSKRSLIAFKKAAVPRGTLKGKKSLKEMLNKH